MPELADEKLRHPAAPTYWQPADIGYAELDVTTNFSFLRGASHADELVYRASELGYRAIAVTDINSVAGIVRMHEAANKTGIKLIIGARLVFTDAPDLLVWVTDKRAYTNLCRMLTLGKRRTTKGECLLTLKDFIDHSDGLLAAMVPPEREPESSANVLRSLKEALGDRVSLAAHCLYGPNDARRLERLALLSRSVGVPLVATNHVHYHDPSRQMLQDVLTCIRDGCTIQTAGFKLFPNGERYLKSPDQMQRLFLDYPQAIQRGLEIAERCTFSLTELKYEYPAEPTPDGISSFEHLCNLTWAGATERYPDGISDKVRAMVEHELQLMKELKIEAYFLTVHDLVSFARSKGILCQGRGSAANSAVCFCLGVTSVDPARIDVLFERFISTARNEPPDIDVDFEHERREEVIQYVYEKYGRDRAGMTAEVISYRGRSAIRDVGKALGLSLDTVDQMAKRLDWWDRGTLTPQKIAEMGLNPTDRTVLQVIELSRQLLGFPRHLSQHVGGLVITRSPLCDLVPIENASMADRTVIEWDKDDIDAVGMMKVDCLALGMLTCIAKAIALINERCTTEPPLELHTIPAEDSVTYDMICRADTIGVFQIESRAQMSMLPRLKPREFYDLVIEVAIVRPGPIQGDMVHPYLRRRCGDEPVVFPSQALKNVLSKTLGVPLFQEQAMKVAMVAGGFTAAEADQLRRAMAAWKRSDKLSQFRDKLISGMIANGYNIGFAEQTWNQIKGFGDYGFPESHAASFALLVYASAWIKCHHPAVFACALLNSQPMGFYAPAQIVRDAREHGVEVLPVDVNHSVWDCMLEGDPPALRLGMRMIKGMRQAHAERVVDAQPFVSVEDFHRRTGLPVTAINRLAEADAFGSVNQSRRPATWQTFLLTDSPAPLFDTPSTDDESTTMLPAMPLGQEVSADYATIGLSLKQHPVSLVRETLTADGIITAVQLRQLKRGWVKVAGIVLIRQRPGTASGIVFMTFEDETGIVNLIVRPNIYDKYRIVARHSGFFMARGYVERKDEVIHVMVTHLEDRSHLLSSYQWRSRDFH